MVLIAGLGIHWGPWDISSAAKGEYYTHLNWWNLNMDTLNWNPGKVFILNCGKDVELAGRTQDDTVTENLSIDLEYTERITERKWSIDRTHVKSLGH